MSSTEKNPKPPETSPILITSPQGRLAIGITHEGRLWLHLATRTWQAADNIASDLRKKLGLEATNGPAVDPETSLEELKVYKIADPGLVGIYVKASFWDNLVSKD